MIAREPTLARLAVAQDLLLSPYGLDEKHLKRALGEILVPGVDDADLYFQYTRAEGWSLEEGIVKTGSFSIDQGVGVRAVSGEKTAFAYSDDLSWTALLDAAHSVRAIGAQGQSLKAKVGARKVAKSRSLYAGLDPIATLDSTTEAIVKFFNTSWRSPEAAHPAGREFFSLMGDEPADDLAGRISAHFERIDLPVRYITPPKMEGVTHRYYFEVTNKQLVETGEGRPSRLYLDSLDNESRAEDKFKGKLWATARYVHNWPETPENKAFVARFQERWGRLPNYSAECTYSAVFALKSRTE